MACISITTFSTDTKAQDYAVRKYHMLSNVHEDKQHALTQLVIDRLGWPVSQTLMRFTRNGMAHLRRKDIPLDAMFILWEQENVKLEKTR